MTNEQIAVEYGKQSAKTFFKDMLNVQYQGENFTWKNFPLMFKGVCAASLFMQYEETPENLAELETLAINEMVQEGVLLKEEYQKNNVLPTK